MPCAPATRRRSAPSGLILAKLKEVDIAARTEANREGVADDKILSMMQGMIKQRNESIVLYEKGNRADLADKEKAEIVVIERFLPQQMDEAAVAGRRRRGHRPPPAPSRSRTWAA